ncbi:MAG: threonine synthase, partial [Kiloniellales bacterium]
EGTKAEIARLYRSTGELIDPHSAIGIAAAAAHRGEKTPSIIALATAHPAKFPEAVAAATGVRPSLPPAFADLMERDERVADLPNDLARVQAFVADRVGLKGAA